MEIDLPKFKGEKFKYKGEIYEFVETRQIQDEKSSEDMLILRSKRYEMQYHPIKFLNDISGGIIQRVGLEKNSPGQSI